MVESELIVKAYELLGQGRVEAAEGYFERYMAARVRVCGERALREAWQRDVAERRSRLAAREEVQKSKGDGRREREGRW